MSINTSSNSSFVPGFHILEPSPNLKEKTTTKSLKANFTTNASEVFNHNKNALSDPSSESAPISQPGQAFKGECINLEDQQLPATQKVDSLGQSLLVGDKLPSFLEVMAKPKANQPSLPAMDRMVDELRLNVIPDLPEEATFKIHTFYQNYESSELKAHYQKCNTEKKDLLALHIVPENASLILNHANKSPLLQSAVAALRENLDLWEDLSLQKSPENFYELKRELAEQMKNLVTLSNHLEGISSSQKSAKVLPTEAGTLDERLLLKDKRQKSPVTKDAIQLQASLHQAMREGKSWAMQQPGLKKLGTSTNDVFSLESNLIQQPAAYFKVGGDSEVAAGTMEKLMWNIAVVMGKENQFVPTGETEVRDKNQQTGGSYRAKQWNKEGDLSDLQSAAEPRKGGIQVAQNGMTLDDVNKAGKTVSRDEVIDATLTSLVFGMFDAHGGNIFVTDEGKIKYFDNTRSMPNSNEFINRGHGIVSSYRCALLDLNVAKKALTLQEIGELKSKVKEYQQNAEKLKKYMSSKEVQGQLNKLPPGWMNLPSSLAAMDQRLSLMEAALNTGQVKTLEDLAIQSNPSYKFAYALAQIEALYQTKGMDISGQNVHRAVGYNTVEDSLQHASKLGIDLELVQKWCKDANLSTADITNQLGYQYAVRSAIPLTNAKSQENYLKNERVFQKIASNAEQDYKDYSRKESMYYMDSYNLRNLCLMGAGVLPEATVQTVESAIFYAKYKNCNIVIFGKSGDFKVLQETPIGFQVKSIDSSFKEGMIREKFWDAGGDIYYGSEMKIADFYNAYAYPQPTNFQELSVLEPAYRDNFAMEKGLLMSKSPEGHLMVTFRLQNENGYFVNSDTFTENDKGAFIVDVDLWLGINAETHCTIDQIASLYGSKVDSVI